VYEKERERKRESKIQREIADNKVSGHLGGYRIMRQKILILSRLGGAVGLLKSPPPLPHRPISPQPIISCKNLMYSTK
jgi:hypothetical protein